jgi:hypothetical protein
VGVGRTTPLNASDIANANGGNAPMVSGGGGSGGCARLDYYVTTTFGSGPLSIGQIVPGGTGLNNGSDGDYRVYLRAAPAISFAAVTGTSPLSSSQLSWGWGGGLLDSFYRLYTVSGTSTVSSSPIFSTANTTTLSYLVTGLTPATRYRYAIQSVSSTPRPVFNLNAGQTLVEIIGTSTYKFVDHVIVPQPLQAVVGPVGPTSVSMALDYGLNPGTTPMTVVDGSGYYYNANGSPSGLTPVYIPVNTWSNSFISLSPSTSYVFTFLPFTPVTDDFSGAITYYQATSSLVVSTTTPLADPTKKAYVLELFNI